MKIVCLARTFGRHAAELGNPVPSEPIWFLKAPSAVSPDGAPILLPPESREVHHEAEAAVVVGQRLTRAPAAAAEGAIEAWTVLCDVTARDLQRVDGGRFGRAKNFDTFCPLSAARLPALDWRRARVQCLVNGQRRQDGALADLLWTPGELLAAVSRVMTLEPGDIVSLGTPEGVGPLVAGDRVECRLVGPEGAVLASVANPVRALQL